ncbi:MAG: hypothetical protein J6R96_07015 [Spirochaetaceae bacterium]|nr:hypothetical protein [Spirochaetaceae bacterium]
MLSIKTRSKTIDYIDYGNTPYTNWEKEWCIKNIGADPMRVPLAGVSAADICLLVDNGQWKGAVYWLYGNRNDKETRSIRYGIVGCGLVGDEDAKIFCRLCAHILEGREAQDNLAQLLDIHFTDEAIQELGNKQRSSKEEAYQQVRGILSQVVGQLPNPADTKTPHASIGGLECSPDMEGCKEKFRQSLSTVAAANFHCANPMLLLYGTSLKVSVEDLKAKNLSGLVVLPTVPKLEMKPKPVQKPREPVTHPAPPYPPVRKWIVLVAGIAALLVAIITFCTGNSATDIEAPTPTTMEIETTTEVPEAQQ